MKQHRLEAGGGSLGHGPPRAGRGKDGDESSSAAGLKVLVVEDHDFQRRALVHLMRSLGASEVLEEWVPEMRRDDHVNHRHVAGATSHSAPALDCEVLASTIGDDREMQTELLCEYRRASASQLAEFAAALAEGDGRRLADRAHQQKGAARAIGATRLGDLCAELENAARAENLALASQLVGQLEIQAAAVDREIGALIERVVVNDADRKARRGDGNGRQRGADASGP